MNLTSDRQLKVLIRNFPIFVHVKFVKKVLELILRKGKTPMLEVETELLWKNLATFFHVQVHEGFSKGFPLEFYFV